MPDFISATARLVEIFKTKVVDISLLFLCLKGQVTFLKLSFGSVPGKKVTWSFNWVSIEKVAIA